VLDTAEEISRRLGWAGPSRRHSATKDGDVA